MLIHITFKNSSPFTFSSIDFEANIDVLSDFIADGPEVEAAILIDSDGNRTVLPLEAFDGKPLGRYMRELESEYEKVLALEDEILEGETWDVTWSTKRTSDLIAKTKDAMRKVEHLKNQKERTRQMANELFRRLDKLQDKIQTLKID